MGVGHDHMHHEALRKNIYLTRSYYLLKALITLQLLVLVLNNGQQLQQGNISLIGQGPFSQSISNFFPMIVKIVLELI